MTVTDPLATAIAPHRTVTAPQPAAVPVQPRLRALCSRDTDGGPCMLPARHDDGCLPPPRRVVRPYEWARR